VIGLTLNDLQSHSDTFALGKETQLHL